MRVAFEACLNGERASARTLINATKHSQYFHFFANREKKIVEKDKIENTCLHSEKRRAIKEYFDNSNRQRLHLVQKKKDIIKPQAFVYDVFYNIKRIHAASGHNG